LRAAVFLLVMLFFLLPLSCSVYRSDGRKFLESDLGTIGVSVQAYVQACDRSASDDDKWQPLENGDQAELFKTDDGNYDLRVIPLADQNFHCDYRFPSPNEMSKKIDDAIEYTLEQLNSAPLKTSHE
jgi:hypothetical protein